MVEHIDFTAKQNSMGGSRSRIQNSSLGGEGVSQYFRDSILMLRLGCIIIGIATMTLILGGISPLTQLGLMVGLIFMLMWAGIL